MTPTTTTQPVIVKSIDSLRAASLAERIANTIPLSAIAGKAACERIVNLKSK